MSVDTRNHTLATGVRMLDRQHELLVEVYRQFYDAVTAQQDREIVVAVLARLVTGTQRHFATEERLMKTLRYSALARHKAEHEALLDKALAVQRQLTSGEIVVKGKLAEFFRQWLLQHTQEADMRLGSFLRQRGIN